MSTSTRQLAAIMYTDIVGYTAIMQKDESGAVEMIKRYNASLEKYVTQFGGRILNYYGDGSLCIFNSASSAVDCSIALQSELRNEPVVPLRIGLHVGEVFFENEKALGDGVNVASRIQSLSQQNTILLSEEVYDKVKNNNSVSAVSLGRFDFKNVGKPMQVFALTNEGLTVPKRRDLQGKLEKKNTSKRNVFAVASVGVAALVIFLVYDSFFISPGVKSIAVLPFVDMSPGQDHEYFSDGLSEELINMLVRVPNLKVTARTSAFAFKGKNDDIRTIASKLKVDYVLEGSVRETADRYKVTAQLIEARDGSHLWSETIEKDKGDILTLQDEIANSVVKTLRVSLLNDIDYGERQANQDALNLYLQGRYNNIHHKVDQAIKNYWAAIRIDPKYTKAWAGLAWTYTIMYPSDSLTSSEILQKRKRFAEKAYSLNPNEPEAIRAMIQVHQGEGDYDRMREMAKRGLDLEPNNVDILLFATNPLYYDHRFGEAISMIKRAIEIDPLNYLHHAVLSGLYLMEGRLDEALESMKTGFELGKDVPGMYYGMAVMSLIDGDIQKSIEYFDNIDFVENPWAKIFSFIPKYIGGRGVEARAILDWAVAEQSDYFPMEIATCFAFMNDFDNAFKYLERARNTQNEGLKYIREDYFFGADLRADPRYKNLLRKMNLPDKQIKWSLYDHLKSKERKRNFSKVSAVSGRK
jgi:adenylate cyclase